jgi:hypothetical protein
LGALVLAAVLDASLTNDHHSLEVQGGYPLFTTILI